MHRKHRIEGESRRGQADPMAICSVKRSDSAQHIPPLHEADSSLMEKPQLTATPDISAGVWLNQPVYSEPKCGSAARQLFWPVVDTQVLQQMKRTVVPQQKR